MKKLCRRFATQYACGRYMRNKRGKLQLGFFSDSCARQIFSFFCSVKQTLHQDTPASWNGRPKAPPLGPSPSTGSCTAAAVSGFCAGPARPRAGPSFRQRAPPRGGGKGLAKQLIHWDPLLPPPFPRGCPDSSSGRGHPNPRAGGGGGGPAQRPARASQQPFLNPGTPIHKFTSMNVTSDR